MGNSKSSLAHEQAILEAAIKETQSSAEFRLRDSKSGSHDTMRGSGREIDAAMIAVMNGEGGDDVLKKIAKYHDERRNSIGKSRRNSSVTPENKPPLDKILLEDAGPPREISFEQKSPVADKGTPKNGV